MEENTVTREEELERELKVANRRLDQLRTLSAYREGQLSVLKRYSDLYPEEEPTKEEFLNSQREILYSPEPKSLIDFWGVL